MYGMLEQPACLLICNRFCKLVQNVATAIDLVSWYSDLSPKANTVVNMGHVKSLN